MRYNEIKQHPKITDLYVTDCGLVFEVRQLKTFNRATQSKIPYKHVNFKGKKYDVHRLVAQTYLDNPDNKPCVCHKDDNPQNNHRGNLWWGTYKENMQDMIAKGRNKQPSGPRGPQAGNKDKHECVAELFMSGEYTLATIGKIMGVTESRISQMISQQKKWGWYSKFTAVK